MKEYSLCWSYSLVLSQVYYSYLKVQVVNFSFITFVPFFHWPVSFRTKIFSIFLWLRTYCWCNKLNLSEENHPSIDTFDSGMKSMILRRKKMLDILYSYCGHLLEFHIIVDGKIGLSMMNYIAYQKFSWFKLPWVVKIWQIYCLSNCLVNQHIFLYFSNVYLSHFQIMT